MQLQLNREQLNLLVAVLEHFDRQPRPTKKCDCTAAELLDKVAIRDLRFSADELDFLSELLANFDLKDDRTAKVLEELRDKVTEACAMA